MTRKLAGKTAILLICSMVSLQSSVSNATESLPPLPTKPPAAPADAGPAENPDSWTQQEIADERRRCRALLKGVAATIEEVEPIRSGACGAPAPVRLISLGKERKVLFSPPPTLTCDMVRALARWNETSLQPLARKHLDAGIGTVSVMSSYSCRTRYGQRGAKLSEHALANALDIGGFVLDGGDRIALLQHWGPTERDLIATAKQAQPDDAPLQARAASDLEIGTARAPARRNEAQPPSSPSRTSVDQAAARSTDRRNSERRDLSSDRRDAAPLAAQLAAPQASAPSPSDFQAPETRRSDDDLMRQMPREARRFLRNYLGISSLPIGTNESRGRGSRTALEDDGPPPPLPVRRPLRHAATVSAVHSEVRPSVSSRPEALRAIPNANDGKTTPRLPTPPYRLGGPKPPPESNVARPPLDPKSLFLREAHTMACRIFGTVLGPEANDAHRNHFHVDMHPRRNGGYCE